VERNGRPLELGRRRRPATKDQRRALLARDGGCARPGCTETRIERLHAHHLTPWRLGGRTDVGAMVLLCDVDHGLVHDEGLRMELLGCELVVHDRTGRRIWGPADTAFDTGVTDGPAGSPASLLAVVPDTTLPESMPAGGERMDLGHVVWALLAHRDHLRRSAA
jgi:hypothetical protein